MLRTVTFGQRHVECAITQSIPCSRPVNQSTACLKPWVTLILLQGMPADTFHTSWCVCWATCKWTCSDYRNGISGPTMAWELISECLTLQNFLGGACLLATVWLAMHSIIIWDLWMVQPLYQPLLRLYHPCWWRKVSFLEYVHHDTIQIGCPLVLAGYILGYNQQNLKKTYLNLIQVHTYHIVLNIRGSKFLWIAIFEEIVSQICYRHPPHAACQNFLLKYFCKRLKIHEIKDPWKFNAIRYIVNPPLKSGSGNRGLNNLHIWFKKKACCYPV